MNQEIKAKWVAALRSGEYSQAKGALAIDNGFCCLGVLTDLYIQEVPTQARLLGLLSMSREVQVWADLDNSEGDEVAINGEVAKLAHHNDGITDFITKDTTVTAKTFAQIADAIEAQL